MGVVNSKGEYKLIDSGPLPEAVAASAAIPFIFAPVKIPGKATSAYLWTRFALFSHYPKDLHLPGQSHLEVCSSSLRYP